MPRRPALTLVPFAIAGSLLLLAACADGIDDDARLDDAADRVTELEDAVDELGRLLVTTSTTVPPPVTQATTTPTTRDPATIRTTTSTTIQASLNDATSSSILALVGDASWDPALPVPAECIANASFSPSGENGINGGVIACNVDAPSPQVEQYFRFALTRSGFAFQGSGGESGFSLTIGEAASINGAAAGDRTDVTIEQRFP